MILFPLPLIIWMSMFVSKSIAVLDRTKEPGALGEPLYMDVMTSLADAGRTDIKVIGGRYGLASKDTPPASVFAVYKELAKANPKARFTVGIVDDVTTMLTSLYLVCTLQVSFSSLPSLF